MRRLENEILKQNKSQIFNDSSDVFGNDIGFYSKATEVITKGRKKAGEPFDLKETGFFLNSLFLEMEGVNAYVKSKDPKLGEIFQNLLSVDIFGLTDKNLNNFIREKLLPAFLNETRKILDI